MVSYLYDSFEKLRLDIYLADKFPQHSRSRIQKWIGKGAVSINSRIILKSGYLLEENDVIQLDIPTPEPTTILPESIELDVIFENADLIIINKPAGMVVHPAAGHSAGTVVNAILAYAPEMDGIGGEGRPGIVHRLDKDTSGILVLAKNDICHRFLQDQFRNRQIHKVYLALVDGRPPSTEGVIEASIARDPSHRKKMAVVPAGKGREAISRYKTLKIFHNHTLIEIHPQTGRTHQIRLHMAFIGCPIVGDRVYGYNHPSLPITRHFLHAGSITLVMPGTHEMKTFTAPLPNELKNILDQLQEEE